MLAALVELAAPPIVRSAWSGRTFRRERELELAPGVWIVRTRAWVAIGAALDTNADLPLTEDEASRQQRLGQAPDWHSWALCSGMDLDVFFGAKKGGEPTMRRSELGAARAICGSCPSVRDCGIWALRNGELHGVWGGTSGRQRTRFMAREIAAGKSPEQVIDEWLAAWLGP